MSLKINLTINRERIENLGVWIHEHPTSAKVMRAVSPPLLGIGIFASLFFITSPLAVSLIAGLTLAGIALATAGAIANLASRIIPLHHEMKNHVFKPAECEGGKIYYEGDVPILSLDSDQPYLAGKAQGYLCGEAIHQILKNLCREDRILSLPKTDSLHQTLNEIRKILPESYKQEMEGLLAGYRQWAKEHPLRFPKFLTEDDILLIQLLPDSMHFNPSLFKMTKAPAHGQEMPAVACTAIIEIDAGKGFVFARNMDWPSFGVIGTYSLIVHRNYQKGLRKTVEAGMPGLIGTLTGMNDRGLSLAMNVCYGSTKEISGMPACFYNRTCLENCSNIEELENFTKQISPLGPYHLTAADSSCAQSIHFYQAIDFNTQSPHAKRHCLLKQPIVTLNTRYGPIPYGSGVFEDKERQRQIDQFFRERNNRPLEDALALPHVNNWITTHKVLMEPQTLGFKVAFDNAFAGKAPLCTVPTAKLFPTKTTRLASATAG